MLARSGDSGPPCGVPLRSVAGYLRPSRPPASSDRSIAAVLVVDTAGDATHQDIVLYSVEEFRQVHVYDEAAASTYRTLYLLCSSMSGTFRSKPVARYREARIEHRRQNLLDGLLNQAIEHVWNSELPLTAIRFVDGLSPHRGRLVGTIEKLLPNRRPLRAKPIGERRQRDAVGARGSTVRADLVPGSLRCWRDRQPLPSRSSLEINSRLACSPAPSRYDPGRDNEPAVSS